MLVMKLRPLPHSASPLYHKSGLAASGVELTASHTHLFPVSCPHSGAGGATLTSLRQLRYHMAHLVNNLAIYIQVGGWVTD